jgi:aldose 1-epimerase
MKIQTLAIGIACAGLLVAGCKPSASPEKMSVTVAPYGVTESGASVNIYTLHNTHGMQVQILNYGARIASIKVPDRTGKIDEVTLGYDSLEGWLGDRSFFGATVGRYANRIAKGVFTLDRISYQLPVKNGGNSLHGGPRGFHKQMWTGESIEKDGRVGVKFRLISPDGDQGFPGKLTEQISYSLGEKNDLRIDYRITTDAPTIVNPTNHTYFNLAGDGSGDVLGHVIQVNASHYTPTDATQIPTGEIAPVEGTPMDLRKPTAFGAHIDDPFPALVAAGGYDHNYVLDGSGFRKVVEVYEPRSGRVLEVLTTEPGVQFYSGNFLANEPGKSGHIYSYRGGFCLETQHFPDSPNHPDFPTTVLRPGETRTSKTTYRFSTR